MARTDNLKNFLTDVAIAIKTKKGSQTSIQASNFDTEITNLPTGTQIPKEINYGSNQTYSVDMSFLTSINFTGRTNYSYMFQNSYQITTIPAFNMDIEATDVNHMFDSCQGLLTTPTFDLPNCTNSGYMFRYCGVIPSVNITRLGTNLTTGGCNCQIMFGYCSYLTNITIGSGYVGNASSMFQNCVRLTSLPTTLDFSRCSAFGSMCSGCTLLEDVPIMNMAKATSGTSLPNMFANCPALTNTSLNNILASLATKGGTATNNRTLKYIGLSSEQATTCTNLSNWSALSNLGWTTGY